jgi:hypothetical protein
MQLSVLYNNTFLHKMFHVSNLKGHDQARINKNSLSIFNCHSYERDT